MKTPSWFRERLADRGPLVLQEDITEEQAAAAIADLILSRDPVFAKAILAEYSRKKLEAWVASHRPASSVLGSNGQTDLFPDLPRKVEVSPGRFAAQAVMTRHDWETAATQARTKANNADGFAEKIERARDLVVPLLTDDSMTTADVWPKQEFAGLFAIGDAQ